MPFAINPNDYRTTDFGRGIEIISMPGKRKELISDKFRNQK
jgi:hypothetical protein